MKSHENQMRKIIIVVSMGGSLSAYFKMSYEIQLKGRNNKGWKTSVEKFKNKYSKSLRGRNNNS